MAKIENRLGIEIASRGKDFLLFVQLFMFDRCNISGPDKHICRPSRFKTVRQALNSHLSQFLTFPEGKRERETKVN